MKEIKNINLIKSSVPEWKPSDVAFISGINWTPRKLTLNLLCQSKGRSQGWPDISSPFHQITLSFKNITSFRMSLDSNILWQVSGFDIVGISDRGLDKIHFLIEDFENDALNFYCEDIEVEEVGPQPEYISSLLSND